MWCLHLLLSQNLNTALVACYTAAFYFHIMYYRLTAIVLLLSLCLPAFSQQNMLLFKRGNKTLERYFKGSFIAFQLRNERWVKGRMVDVSQDSVSINPEIVIYRTMGSDTFHLLTEKYAFADIYAVPKKGYLIDYNGRGWGYNGAGGHVHWYWVKSGWLFRTLGLGYMGLHMANGIIKNEAVFKDGRLAVAAGLVGLGFWMKHRYKPYIKINRRYHFVVQ